MTAAVDLALAAAWLLALGFVALSLRTERRRRHVWAELDSTDVAAAHRAGRGR